MDQLSSIFHKFSTQIWYFLAIPVFFMCFILIYVPFGAREFFDAGRDMYAFNVTMCICIIFGCAVAVRSIFYSIFRKREISYLGYSFWCLGEVMVMSLFCALYMWLIYRIQMPYFSVLGTCAKICILTLDIPYLVITLLLCLFSAGDGQQEPDADALVRFTDNQQRLKLVIASSAILYIEAEENYVRIHYLESGIEKEYVLRNSMKTIDELVSRHGLVRSHRSYVLNPLHVKVLRKDKDGVILAELDAVTKEIPVSKKHYESLSALL